VEFRQSRPVAERCAAVIAGAGVNPIEFHGGTRRGRVGLLASASRLCQSAPRNSRLSCLHQISALCIAIGFQCRHYERDGSLRGSKGNTVRPSPSLQRRADTVAAPATVSGERRANLATGRPGRRRNAKTREPGDLPSIVVTHEHVGRGGPMGTRGRFACKLAAGFWLVVACHVTARPIPCFPHPNLRRAVERL
jgi:hypothetical protein